MHVLLIEDNKAVAEMIKLLLAGKGFNITVADCGEDGIDLAKRYNYDIIILDLQLPDISGLHVLRTLRSAAIATPVMVLSGNMVVDAKVKALGIGADDYLTKPFHKDELIARIHAVVRRSQGHSQTVIATGKLSVNLDSRTVEAKGVRVPVTAREYQILELLSLRKGATLSKSCSWIISMAAWTSPKRRSSMCSYASCARSSRPSATANSTSRPSGARATGWMTLP